jgi:shikimate kinase
LFESWQRWPILRNKTTALTHSAITVVSAFATGKGVTIGIDIPCLAKVELSSKTKGASNIVVKGNTHDPHDLVRTSAAGALDHIGVKLSPETSLIITIDSKIPTAVGLKSSSAVSVAVTKAIFDLFSRANPDSYFPQKILRVSCEASIDSGASLTGAFDDAAACLLGGLVFSDNHKFKLLGHQSLDGGLGTAVKILIPGRTKKLTSSLSLSTYKEYDEQIREAIQFARRGVIVQAMLLNSIIHSVIHRYSMRPIVSSIAEGASAAGVSGKGPAIAAICPNNKTASRVENRWREDWTNSRIMTASINPVKEVSVW